MGENSEDGPPLAPTEKESVTAAPPRAGVTTRRRRAGLPITAIERAIRLSQRALLRLQSSDGAWRYPLEGSSVLPESHLVIANHLFDVFPQALEARLVERIRARQLPNGAWPLHPGHEGHLSATVEAYLALRLHGVKRTSEGLRAARRFVSVHGGLAKVSSLTRITLAVLDQIDWAEVPLLPIEILLLPKRAPFSLYSFVSFTRMHLVSILALGEMRYRVERPRIDVARELNGTPHPRWDASAIARRAMERLSRYAGRARRFLSPVALRERSLDAAREYLLAHQEPDGSWGNYILSTLFGMLALRALGYPDDSVLLSRAKEALRSLVWTGGELLAQPCNSTIWSTALIASTLRETGLSAGHPSLHAAARWLLDRQSYHEGDWKVRCPEAPTGNWGFQEGNALFPDVDDTIAAVRAIRSVPPRDRSVTQACERGEEWALAMQNSDGGWSSFDRNCGSWWLERVPFNDMIRAMTDPSTPDMTGRVLEFLGVRGFRLGRREVDRALAWLRTAQRKDGSWFGRWGIAYLYGTWAALMGIGAVGAERDPMAGRAVGWLESAQNADGGWGESCRSDTEGKYVPLGFSTPSQSAWGLMGLLAVAREATPAIRRGVDYLLNTQRADGTWPETYTTGAGFAGKLYLDYRFYKDVWPLEALGLARSLAIRGRTQ